MAVLAEISVTLVDLPEVKELLRVCFELLDTTNGYLQCEEEAWNQFYDTILKFKRPEDID